jgi:ribosomal protein S18 acetylase RimI-like enzyme
MPFQKTSILVRPAQETDRLPLSNLFYFEPYVHSHLDWKRPLDWLGASPFLVAEHKGRVIATLSCPPDPPGVAWIRGFAASGQVRLEKVWGMLWREAFRILAEQGEMRIAALCADAWMQKLLTTSGFSETDSVVVLDWDGTMPIALPRSSARPRVMAPGDLPWVFELDWLCFDPLWRNSEAALQLAFKQAVFATVVEEEGKILGYQLSTPSPNGGHLARLAVDPGKQGRGLGYGLVYDLLVRFSNQGATHVSVNTQAENKVSLALYEKACFRLRGHRYPVYEYKGERVSTQI